MSQQTGEAQTGNEPPEGAGEGANDEGKTFDADYVEKLRKESAKYRTEAKANAAAATRLAELEEQQKTAEQKAADRESAALKRAEAAEARALRRDIALEFELSREDAELLDDLTDEDAMRRHAERYAGKAAERKKQGTHVPGEGKTTTHQAPDQKRSFLRDLNAGRT